MGLDQHLVLGEYQLSFHQNDLPRLAKLRSTRLHFFSPIKNNYPVSRRDTERGASCNDGLLCRFYRSTDPVFPSLSDRNMYLERFDHTERGLACQENCLAIGLGGNASLALFRMCPSQVRAGTAKVDPLVEKPTRRISGIPPRMASHWPSAMAQPFALEASPSKSCFRRATVVPL